VETLPAREGEMKVSQDWSVKLLRSLAQDQLEDARRQFRLNHLYSTCKHLASFDALTYLADRIEAGQPRDIDTNWFDENRS
jgi:hypothetical protein